MPRFKIVLAPHQVPDNWNPLHPVGMNGNYFEIVKVRRALIKGMKHCYSIRTTDKQTFEPITVILDEYPAIAQSLECEDIAREFLRVMLFEARKVSIRLVLQSQSDRVEALGLKGFSDVRDSMKYLRLGEAALNQAKSLKRGFSSNGTKK